MNRAVRRGVVSTSYASSRGVDVPDDYQQRARHEVFAKRTLDNAMSPHGVTLRESRDSEEHPESLAIIIALDVTGSMGNVPHALVQEGLPHIMERIIGSGIAHPQVLFLAVGDHKTDRAPLQVGQFESSDELLDNWLTTVFLEGHGGGNEGESYHLAWHFAGTRTDIDCLTKRKQKGFLFTIGDEPCHRNISESRLRELYGEGEFSDFTANELLELAREKYECFHLHIRETSTGRRERTMEEWRERMGDNLLIPERHTDVAASIAQAILDGLGVAKEDQVEAAEVDTSKNGSKSDVEMM
jgi:hypothetical protein